MPLRSCSVADAKLFRNYRKAGYPLLGWQCCELFTKSLGSNYEVAKLFQWRCDAAAKPLRTRCKTVAMLARKPRSRFRSCSDDAAKFFPKPTAKGSRLGESPTPSQRRALPSMTLAHHWQAARLAFLDVDAGKGMPMMRKAHGDRHLRIIGRPSRSHADCVGGLPMMRKCDSHVTCASLAGRRGRT